jgi:hypothetical protein
METQKVSKQPPPSHDSIGATGAESRTQAYLDQVKATIRDSGWAMQVVPVFTDEDLCQFTYVYTIGLIERKCTAELMIVGLPYRQGADIINQIALNMINHGQTIPPDEWPLAGGFQLKSKVFVPRVGGELHVGVARAYYGGNVPMAQYVWPDAEHRYPWDEDWDPELPQPVGNR